MRGPLLLVDSLFLWGYEMLDVKQYNDENALVSIVKHEHPRFLLPVAVSLGIHLVGAAPCVPRRQGFEAQQRACTQRIGRVVPEIRNRALLRRLRTHVYAQCRKRLKPLMPNTDFGFKLWLTRTHYTDKRKEELRKVWENIPARVSMHWVRRHAKCKSFIKLESYPMYKNPRGICSRSDGVKCWIGPIIKAIEQEVYKLPEFIKHVPVPDRAKYVYGRLFKPGCKYVSTDYSSYEASFHAEIMHVCEFVMLRYMCRLNPDALRSIKMFEKVCCGKNVMVYKDVTMAVIARRMSGEMTTSLCNGWTNLMLSTLIIGDYENQIEGDDGLVAIPVSLEVSSDDFAEYGFVIKIEVHERIEEASFCGIVFDSVDLMNCADPIDELVKFGWHLDVAPFLNEDKRGELLVAKAYSLLYEYPGCPIMKSLAAVVFRCEKRNVGRFSFDHFIQNRAKDEWERGKFMEIRNHMSSMDRVRFMLARPINSRSRLLVERVYKVPLDIQLRTEQYLDSMTSIHALDMPWILSYVHRDIQDNCKNLFAFKAGVPMAFVRSFRSWRV